MPGMRIKLLLNSLTRACKLTNDVIKCRFPIKKGLLELILCELKRVLDKQLYLQIMYKAMFCLAYYGLMRIGELTEGPHVCPHKIMIKLYSSKTHGKKSYPQTIKVTALNEEHKKTRLFCPFKAIRHYIKWRAEFLDQNENFFIFQDRSAVLPNQARDTLRDCLENLNLNPKLYDFHSFRIGKATDMKLENYSITEIKSAGRWRSNAIYRYLRE